MRRRAGFRRCAKRSLRITAVISASRSDRRHVCVTSGATEALGAAILATVEPGDEVIIFTPGLRQLCADDPAGGGDAARSGAEAAAMADRARRRSRRRSAPKTRAILFNNPHNPTGRLFDAEELEIVADVARDHDLIVISDEVWEHIVLDGQQFTPLATLPGMAERTIKIGSAGKIFSLTGWKVGWMVAAPELASLVARAHQFLTFAPRPISRRQSRSGSNEGDAWIEPMRERFARARDRMTNGLARVPASRCSTPASTYFLCVDLQRLGTRCRRRELSPWRRSRRPALRWCPFRRSPSRTRRATSCACASARRTRRSTPASRRWPGRRSCFA